MPSKISSCCFIALLCCFGNFLIDANAQTSPPYAVNWINLKGVSINNAILTRTATTGSWSAAGAITSNLLDANTDGWMEFTALSGSDYIIGLAANNLINYSEFTQSIQLTKNSDVAVAHEGAANGVSLGTFQSGDVFRISCEGKKVVSIMISH